MLNLKKGDFISYKCMFKWYRVLEGKDFDYFDDTQTTQWILSNFIQDTIRGGFVYNPSNV